MKERIIESEQAVSWVWLGVENSVGNPVPCM
jgi:hypothetical protein